MPLVGEKVIEGTPLMRREKKAEEVSRKIQVTQFWSKPKASSIAFIYSQLSLSKALEMSSFKSILGVLVFYKE